MPLPSITPRKVVIPIGMEEGLPQPALEALPTEMPAHVERHLLRYAVDEALASGLDELILVTQDGQTVVEDHLCATQDLENESPIQSTAEPSGSVERPRRILISRHEQWRSLGHAIWSARTLIGEEPFAVLMPGELFFGEVAAMRQLIERYKEEDGIVVSIAADGLSRDEGTFAAIAGASTGRYILQPDIFGALERQDGWDLNRAVLSLAEVWPLRTLVVRGAHFDGRSHAGFLEAQIAYGLRHGKLTDVVSGILQRSDNLRSQSPMAVDSRVTATSE